MENKYNNYVRAAAMILCLIASSAYGQSLKGSLKDFKNGSLILFLEDVDVKETQMLDTVPVIDGKFSYILKSKTATRVIMAPLLKQKKDEKNKMSGKFINAILVPGEHVVINGSFDKYQISGPAFYREYQNALIPVDEYDNKLKALYEKYGPLVKIDNPNDSIVKLYSTEKAALLAGRKATILSYIKKHPDSDASTALVAQLDMDDVNEGLALLTKRAKEGKLSDLYKSILKIIQERKDKEQITINMEGKPAPNFTLPDLDGKMISLSSFLGKYVVVDFWGSWCHWCIKGIPEMKKLYDKYKDKMEIISVDCEDTAEKWHEAVAKHEMPWTQVRCDKTCDVTTQYNVSGFPTKCIVSKDGNVIKSFVGESEEFYDYLDTLLN